MAEIAKKKKNENSTWLKQGIVAGVFIILATVIGSLIVVYAEPVKSSLDAFFGNALVIVGVGIVVFSILSDIILYVIISRKVKNNE